jgi:broad specificity phosphatase PhoE
MKRILLLRHSRYDEGTGNLTSDGMAMCRALAPKLPHFQVVMSSPAPRAIRTAELLSSNTPNTGVRLRFPSAGLGYSDQITKRRKAHPLGAAGAIYEIEALHQPFHDQAGKLLGLIKSTLNSLPENGVGLFVSHDGLMVALDKFVHGQSFEPADHTYKELEGFWVDENLKITPFSPNY